MDVLRVAVSGRGAPAEGQVSVACQDGLRLGSPWQKAKRLVVGKSPQRDKCPLRAKVARGRGVPGRRPRGLVVGESPTVGQVSVACQDGLRLSLGRGALCCVSDWLEGETRIWSSFDSACNCGQFGM